MSFAQVLRTAALCCVAVLAAGTARADPYPSKPIKIYVGFAPGGGTDTVARIYGAKLQELWNTPVVVENKPGASELLAVTPVIRSQPDSSYLAQFSLPYAMAACLTRKQFTLQEIEEEGYTNPDLLALAAKVRYEMDPNAGFPKTRTGEVIVDLRDGTQLRERNEIDPDEPAPETQIIDKFIGNTADLLSTSRVAEMRDRILAVENERDMRELAELFRPSPDTAPQSRGNDEARPRTRSA